MLCSSGGGGGNEVLGNDIKSLMVEKFQYS